MSTEISREEEIMYKYIPNGCVNLKSYTLEKFAIIAAMKEYGQQEREDKTRIIW